MFGISTVVAGIKRLGKALNDLAGLVETATEDLRPALTLEKEEREDGTTVYSLPPGSNGDRKEVVAVRRPRK